MHRNKFKTRRHGRHNTTEGTMSIFTRAFIARAVIEARAIDQRDGTDTALQRVADLVHMTPEQVALIAAEEAQAEVSWNRTVQAIGDAERALADVAAHSIGIRPEGGECRGCGACGCGKAVAEA